MTRGATNGTSARHGRTWKAGQRSGLAVHVRLESPASDSAPRVTGASSATPATAQSRPVMRRGRYRTRRVPADASAIAPTTATHPTRPATAAAPAARPTNATNAPARK